MDKITINFIKYSHPIITIIKIIITIITITTIISICLCNKEDQVQDFRIHTYIEYYDTFETITHK